MFSFSKQTGWPLKPLKKLKLNYWHVTFLLIDWPFVWFIQKTKKQIFFMVRTTVLKPVTRFWVTSYQLSSFRLIGYHLLVRLYFSVIMSGLNITSSNIVPILNYVLGPRGGKTGVLATSKRALTIARHTFTGKNIQWYGPGLFVFSIFLALPFLSAPQMALFPCAGPLNLSEGVSSWISPQYRGVCVCTDEGIWAQIHERIQCK